MNLKNHYDKHELSPEAHARIRSKIDRKRKRRGIKFYSAVALTTAAMLMISFIGNGWLINGNNSFVVHASALELTANGIIRHDVDLNVPNLDIQKVFGMDGMIFSHIDLQVEGENIQNIEFRIEDGYFAIQPIYVFNMGNVLQEDNWGAPLEIIGNIITLNPNESITELDERLFIGRTLRSNEATRISEGSNAIWAAETMRIYNDISVIVDVTVTFNNGTTQSQSIEIAIGDSPREAATGVIWDNDGNPRPEWRGYAWFASNITSQIWGDHFTKLLSGEIRWYEGGPIITRFHPDLLGRPAATPPPEIDGAISQLAGKWLSTFSGVVLADGTEQSRFTSGEEMEDWFDAWMAGTTLTVSEDGSAILVTPEVTEWGRIHQIGTNTFELHISRGEWNSGGQSFFSSAVYEITYKPNIGQLRLFLNEPFEGNEWHPPSQGDVRHFSRSN